MTTPASRILLTDGAVERQPFAPDKPRIVRDTKVAGLHVWIGKRKKTYRYQYETPRVNGARGRTHIAWLGEHPHHTADAARAQALAIQAARIRGEPVWRVTEVQSAPELTFGEAWAQYRAAIAKEGKSPRTIADYQDKFDRHLASWHGKPLAAISRDEVGKQHAAITERARKVRKLFMLLSGLRRQDVLTARWDHLDLERKALRIPAPKGGADRAFDLPLSTAMLACLERAREVGSTFFPDQGKTWLFPAETGHIVEVKEEGKARLSHTGHALRHSFRTLAAAAGIDRLRLKILMNHAIDGDVTDSYANVPALFGSLMEAQERISAFIVTAMKPAA